MPRSIQPPRRGTSLKAWILAALLSTLGHSRVLAAVPDLCAGLVQDKVAHAMTSLTKPALGGAVTDPQFGTTIRRITAVPVGEGANAIIKPTYSTMPAWNADESLLILWHRGKGHELYDGRTYKFIRLLSELYNGSNPTDIEQVFWDPVDSLTLYFPSSYNALPYLYRVQFGPGGLTSTKSLVHDFSAVCPVGDWGRLLSAGTDPFWMSWGDVSGRVIGLECDTTKLLYDITTDKVLAKSTIAGSNAPAVVPSGSLAYLDGKVYDVFNGALRLVRTLTQANPWEHASIGRSAAGNDAYNSSAYDAAPGWSEFDTVGTLVTHNMINGTWKVVIGMKTGYPYPPSGTHISSAANQAPGWVGVSVVGATSGATVLANELLLANIDTGIVCRVGHHRSWAGNGKWGYWSEPHLNISRTGTRLLFASDWGNGSSVDTYVVELPGYSGGPVNQAASVNAGADQTLSLPSSVTLAGTASDDGLPNPPGTITTTWSKQSGPGSVSFASPSSLATTASFSVDGTYVIRLTASDGALSASDDVVVTVKPQPGDTTAPVVALTAPAGGATVSANVNVVANASDNVAVAGVQFLLDGVALGAEDTASPYGVAWDTTKSADGTHVLTAAARDAAGNLGVSTAVSVAVSNQPLNQSPVANAGADQTIVLPASATLAGTVSDDGLPNPPGAITISWSLMSGPGNVSFASPGSLTTTAGFPVDGTYTIRLTASDGVRSAGDDVVVTVKPQPGDTTAPAVALTSPANGATVPAKVSVAASASDNVAVVGVQFLLDGVVLGAEDTAAPYGLDWDTTKSANGTRVLTAAARDAAGNFGVSTAVSVMVASQTVNMKPVVNAGPDQTIRLPNLATLAGTASDDGLPSLPGTLSVRWTKVSGPAKVSFANPASPITAVSFAKAGTYVLRLTASDGALSATDKVTVTVRRK